MEKKSVGYIEGNLKIRYKYPLGDHVVEAIFLSLFTLGLWFIF